MTWLGEGRKLTQTGRIGLADARHDVDDPPVWRQVLIPAAYPLSRVHRVIQAAMGWENCHMHAFQIGKTTYGPDLDGELGKRQA